MDEDIFDLELSKKMTEVASKYSDEDGARILHAFEYALVAHNGQKRRSGEPYIIHPVECACIIQELGLDADSIIAGLLHDCIEDTPITYFDIEREFGAAVAAMVDGVTKLGHIIYNSREEEQMEDLRKMFVAMAKDIRVIIIKLADRLHNMRTIQFKSEQKQRDIALETMEIYAPLAHRLGMQGIKWELEDSSLKVLDPVGYGEIQNYLNEHGKIYDEFLEKTVTRITTRLEEAGIQCEVKFRLKHIYSIYRKFYGQNLNFDEIYDICATRIVVKDLADCYNVLGFIHDLYKPLLGRFKDYISMPKPNGYQSLHTVVLGTEGIPFEVQIRTREMDNTAEYGIAAHWKYKDGLKGKQKEEAFAWVRQLIESQQETDAEDFIKNMKVDLFADEVYVFTPQGDVISLPQGANPIDFAYAIHSAVGNRMTGAKVNGRIVNIDYTLKSGEIVSITTSKAATGPKRDWIQLVKTNSAKSKIKQWFKKERREENIEQGKQELDRELKINLLYDFFMQEDVLALMLKRLDVTNLDDLYSAVGYGGIAVSRIVGKVKEESQRQARAQAQATKIVTEPKKHSIADTGVIVEGIDNCLVKFAKCCTPIPGDEIIGFVTRGYGVSVHRKECLNVRTSQDRKDEDGRWIKTQWDYTEKHKYNTGIKVTAKARVGVLSDVVTVLSNMKINVSELTVRDTEPGQSTFFMSVIVASTEQLELLMTRLKRVGGVSEVGRNIAGGQQ